MQTLDNKEKEKCRTSKGLFQVLNEKLKSQHNKTMLSLPYCKLIRE